MEIYADYHRDRVVLHPSTPFQSSAQAISVKRLENMYTLGNNVTDRFNCYMALTPGGKHFMEMIQRVLLKYPCLDKICRAFICFQALKSQQKHRDFEHAGGTVLSNCLFCLLSCVEESQRDREKMVSKPK